jgi:hypothetical protein
MTYSENLKTDKSAMACFVSWTESVTKEGYRQGYEEAGQASQTETGKYFGTVTRRETGVSEQQGRQSHQDARRRLGYRRDGPSSKSYLDEVDRTVFREEGCRETPPDVPAREAS